MFGKPRSPEKVLEDVEIYLADINVPSYIATQALKKAIKAYPDNAKLKEKLKEIQANHEINNSQSSPKTLYGILVLATGTMGLGLLVSWAANKANILGLLLGIAFIFGTIVIFKQYKKEK